jgi:hypothetical protein
MVTSQSMPKSPSVSCRISTSAPTLDLSIPTPFTMTVAVKLDYTYPITISKWDVALFNKLLTVEGLTFTDTQTGRQTTSGRNRACAFRVTSDDPFPRESDKDRWVTLFPDQPYNLQASFRPKFVGDPASNTETHEEQARSWEWPWTGGLESEQTYKIGMVDGSKMKE